MKRALIVVDIQNDFCKGGALEVENANEIVPVANKLIKKFEKNNELIIATKDWHPLSHQSFAINSDKKIGEFGELHGLPQVFWPVHCVQNTTGSEFHPELKAIENIVYKGVDDKIDSYSGFFDNGKKSNTKLDDMLKDNEIEVVYIIGLATDYCVKYTALDAAELGYDVYLVEDACRAVNLNLNDSNKALEEMREANVKIVSSKNI